MVKIMLRIEFKKKNKNNNKSAKGAYEYITRSGLNRKEEIAKSTDLIFTSSKIPSIFEKENQFWNTIDKNESSPKPLDAASSSNS